jgi:hypothetical protein
MPEDVAKTKAPLEDEDNPAAGEGAALGLVDDRALENAEGDLLGHQALAEELAGLARGVTLPASIALYGPWGAGKSGIKNLLACELKKHPDVRFAAYDAFKHSATPLRRDFLIQVGTDLGGTPEHIQKRLYEDSTENHLVPSIPRFLALAEYFALAFLCSFVILLIAIEIVLAATGGNLVGRLESLLTDNFVSLMAPSAVLAGLVALATRSLFVETRTSAVDSDEQFEAMFKEIVGQETRTVIFIDELDRCSPSDVVTTLETIRTFLDVKKCVFIVAADQQVLEQALSVKARQATPVDLANPYYSSGSAYLDKIFQYQFELPPLMSRRLTGFAKQLVRDLQGPWKEVDIDEIIPILIPTHVRSPRRVKALLNSFALTYRLAKRREDQLDAGAVSERAPELAKLVCLRREFPLFAAELPACERLPELIPLLADGASTEGYRKAAVVLGTSFLDGTKRAGISRE